MPDRPRLTQTESGKAWEYGLARAFADLLNIPLTLNDPRKCGQEAYEYMLATDQHNIKLAAGEAALFLQTNDKRLLHDNPQSIDIQSDMKGVHGDVRDIIIKTTTSEIGISAKHRHKDLKHPRLSSTIDWPYQWTEDYATNEYWNDINPLFHRIVISDVEKWRELPDKINDFYLPLLQAFMRELERQYKNRGDDVARNFMRYMIGRYDFYKVMKENGNVSMQSFNMSGTLGWGRRVSLPSEIISIRLRPHNQTTVIITFNRGWALSMRIHNAETRLTPSVKFAVGLEGQPPTLTNHSIPYG